MKFLVDNQLPAALSIWLAQNGRHSIHVLDLQMNEAADASIWSYAQTNGFTVISKDEDFANRASISHDVQVLWARLGNCRNCALLSAFERQIGAIVAALEAGATMVELWPPPGE